jgi:diacylglycerol kinase (ATP)
MSMQSVAIESSGKIQAPRPMRKAALLYNPDSGRRGARRQAQLNSVLALLEGAKIETELFLAESAASAARKARKAIADGCDTVFACGGDGTIHNIVQVLANTPVALGVLPMGTANALAHDLGLPNDVLGAAQAAVDGVPRRVGLGRIQFNDLEGRPSSRFFVVAAGAGVDAHLFYKLYTAHKQRLGMTAYYAQAWKLWFNHPMTRFQIEFAETGSAESRQAVVTELLTVRIRNFGGILRELAPGASLDRTDIRLVYCTTASRTAYLTYVAGTMLGQAWKVPGIDLAYTERVACGYVPDTSDGAQARVYVEADGELLGRLPAEITVVPDALTVMAPGR